jgi:uncharacterized membrane protein
VCQSKVPCKEAVLLRTFYVCVRVRVLFYRLEIILILVLVVWLDNVAVRVKSWRVALQDVSLVACVLDALFQLASRRAAGARLRSLPSCTAEDLRGSLNRFLAHTGPCA